MQHAAEMLLKAILVQRRVKVFDPNKQTSIGFEKCINLAIQHAKLTAEERVPRDNQGETTASIRMRMRRGWTDGARAEPDRRASGSGGAFSARG
jgi:hypothetical protein